MTNSPYLELNVAEDNVRSEKVLVTHLIETVTKLKALIESREEKELEWVFIPQSPKEEVAFIKMMALLERIEGREEEWVKEQVG